MASGNAIAKRFQTTSLTPAGGLVRAEAYGGLVGQMMDEIDARMAPAQQPVAVAETPEDFLHQISVLCGYLGLVGGVLIVAAFFLIAMR